jgi:hypothetical protein
VLKGLRKEMPMTKLHVRNQVESARRLAGLLVRAIDADRADEIGARLALAEDVVALLQRALEVIDDVEGPRAQLVSVPAAQLPREERPTAPEPVRLRRPNRRMGFSFVEPDTLIDADRRLS